MRCAWAALAVLLAPLAPLVLPAGAQLSRARPDSANAPAHFPDMLRAAHVGGTVRVRVVVDSAGHAMPGSVRVLHSDHELYLAALRNVLPRWRFAPAQRDGHAIADTIEQEVRFVFPGDPAVAIAAPQLLERATLAPGRYRQVVGWPGPAPVAATVGPAERREISLAVLDTLVAGTEPAEAMPARIVCVGMAAELNVQPLDAPALERLARPRLAVVVTQRCPPTLTSMIARVSDDGKPVGRPPGDDPWLVEIERVRPYTADIALADAVLHHGTGTTHYRCRVDRDAGSSSAWHAACEVSSMEVSSTLSSRPGTGGIERW